LDVADDFLPAARDVDALLRLIPIAAITSATVMS
jgi:hypothetical protein